MEPSVIFPPMALILCPNPPTNPLNSPAQLHHTNQTYQKPLAFSPHQSYNTTHQKICQQWREKEDFYMLSVITPKGVLRQVAKVSPVCEMRN